MMSRFVRAAGDVACLPIIHIRIHIRIRIRIRMNLCDDDDDDDDSNKREEKVRLTYRNVAIISSLLNMSGWLHSELWHLSLSHPLGLSIIFSDSGMPSSMQASKQHQLGLLAASQTDRLSDGRTHSRGG